MNKQKVINKFKNNHQTDGFANDCYDNIINEIIDLTVKEEKGK